MPLGLWVQTPVPLEPAEALVWNPGMWGEGKEPSPGPVLQSERVSIIFWALLSASMKVILLSLLLNIWFENILPITFA